MVGVLSFRILTMLVGLQVGNFGILYRNDLLCLHVVFEQLDIICSEPFSVLGNINVELLYLTENIMCAVGFALEKFTKHRGDAV